MATKRTFTGSQYVAAGVEYDSACLLTADDLADMKDDAVTRNQEECQKKTGETCAADGVLILELGTIVMNFFCIKEKGCPAFCGNTADQVQIAIQQAVGEKLLRVLDE